MRCFLKSLSLTSGLIVALFLTGISAQFASAQTTITQAQQSNRTAEADRLFREGVQSYEAKQIGRAIALWEQAAKIYQDIGDRQWQGKTLTNLGNAYDDLSQPDKALAAYKAAIQLFQAVKDRSSEARATMNLGFIYSSTSRYEEALAAFSRVIPIYRELNDRHGEARAIRNRGNVYLGLSQHADAIEAFDQAITIFGELKDRANASGASMNQGIAYSQLGQYEDALITFNLALFMFRELKDQKGEQQALTNRAAVYSNLFRYKEALAAYDEVLPMYQKLGDRSSEAKMLLSRGVIYFSLNRYDEALADYRQALPIFRAIKNRDGEAQILSNRGAIDSALSRYEDAIAAYQQALLIFRAIKNRDGEATTLNNLGIMQIRTRQFAQAEQSLRAAIALYESIRLDRLSEAAKISVFEIQSGSYRWLQQALIAQNQPEKALTVSEWGRTKALIERLSQQLQPNTSQTTRNAPDLNTLTQIARSQNATLVEYSTIYDRGKETQLYIWVIQPNGKVSFRQVDLTTALPKQCSQIAQLIGNSRNSIGVRSAQSDWLIVDETAQKNPCSQSDSDENFKVLHKLLIEPIASLLPTDPNQHVVFIPDRTLFLVPFPALKAANGKYLIEKHTLRTASSIQLLDKTRALKSRPRGKDALIVGNPFMPNDPNSSQVKQLSNLPNAEQEAMTIASLFNTQAITGKQGTKKTVLKQMLDAKIIHLATHGSFDDRNGFRSWLALAPFEKDSGILTAEEITRLKLNADLVVLSACDTGRGRVTGDGVVGLSRSFIAAGVPSVIVSLWAVPDAPTSDLMKAFYQQLQRNPDKAQALRQAMLATLKAHPNPKDWAAFTLIGEAL